MRSRIDRSGAKPFFRFSFSLFGFIAAGWLLSLGWMPLMPWLMPALYFMLGAGTGIFNAANVSYLAKILPIDQRALPVALHGALTFFTGGLAPIFWGIFLKGGGAMPSLSLPAFQGFFLFTLAGAVALVIMVNRLEEKPGHVDPILEGGWLFRPFRVVSTLINLARPPRPPGPKDENPR
jgi:MFS family permease